ncbi:MAG TPA: FAD-binding oxidoreductase, partial [Streptosporangiaceae bacterium]
MTHTAMGRVGELRSVMEGPVIVPGDLGFDDARRVWNAGIDRRPSVIARCASAADVVAAIGFAREHRLEVSVRGGAHNPAGTAVCDDGLMVDLSLLNAVTVDPAARRARAGGGALLADLDAATLAHGLAVPAGLVSHTGVGGLTLGGGMGWLTRKFGLSIDNLVSAGVVTADGRVLRAAADDNPDLFWAIRGGGGNFGVVTRLRYQLHDVSEFTGGILVLPASADVLYRFLAEAEAAPDALSTIANVMGAPPMPFLPPEVHGRPIVLAMLAWTGDADAGERAFAPFRALAEPLADMVRPMPYTGMYQPADPDYHPVAAARTGFAPDVDAATVVDWIADAPGRVVQ